MGKHIDRMRGWIDTFSEDVAAVKRIVESPKAPAAARAQAAAALNYLVTRMDLIPDWEETCGVIDDAMILRVSAAIAADKGAGADGSGLDGAAGATLARLANEAEVVSEFLGPVLYPKLKKYTTDLVGKEVRGRKPQSVVEDPKLRAMLYAEIEEELRRLPPAPMSDPDGVERTIKNYLSQKL
jgi:uncharacterized membrane protein YkvA (DUF1232 family)